MSESGECDGNKIKTNKTIELDEVYFEIYNGVLLLNGLKSKDIDNSEQVGLLTFFIDLTNPRNPMGSLINVYYPVNIKGEEQAKYIRASDLFTYNINRGGKNIGIFKLSNSSMDIKESDFDKEIPFNEVDLKSIVEANYYTDLIGVGETKPNGLSN